MSKYLRVIFLLGTILLAVQAVADPPQKPVFDQPEHLYIKDSYCNRQEYQFNARIVNPPPGSNNPIRYHLVSGEGEIDSKTGLWSWQPDITDKTFRRNDIVVAASIGNNPETMTSGDENVTLRVFADNYNPIIRINGRSPQSNFSVMNPGINSWDITIFEKDSCDSNDLYVSDVIPPVSGLMYIENDQLIFDIAEEDLNKKFYVEIQDRDYPRGWREWILIDTRTEVNFDFVDCRDTVITGVCQNLNINFHATDFSDSTYNIPDGFKYYLLSGPGDLSQSGAYSFIPDMEYSGSSFDLRVLAIYNTDKFHKEVRCHTHVIIEPRETEIIFRDHQCGDTIVIDEKPYSWMIMVKGVSSSVCGFQDLEVISIEPELIGTSLLHSLGNEYFWAFTPDIQDVGKTFKIKIGMEDVTGDSVFCDLYIKTDWETPKPKSFQIRIGQINNAQAGSHVTVPVYLDSASHGIGGFELGITYNNQALSYQQCIPGSLFDTENGCDWEFFYCQPQQSSIYSVDRVIRIVGIAETNNGADHPTCFLPEESSPILFNLDFIVTNDRTFECTNLPLNFTWLDCNDNNLSSVDGTEIYVSDSVYYITEDSYGNPPHLENITDPDTGFPTFTGFQPSECSGSIIKQSQAVDFISGGVQVICSTPIDTSLTGDVNLNGVPFEIADLVLFTTYFPYGPGVFGDTLTASSRTDVNLDGNNLTVADWVYFRNIVIGNAIGDLDYLYDTLTAEIAYNKEQHLLQANTDMQYGALYLVVDTIVTPQLLAENMDLIYWSNFEERFTRIFVFSYEDESFGAGQILGGLSGNIITMEVADSDGRVILTPMNIVMGVNDNLDLLPNEFGLAQNYPNPFNNSTVISFSLPNAQEVEFEIVNILGKKVYSETRRYEAGIHQIYWEGNVASGIYYYRIKAGDKVATRKMMLLK